MLPEIFEVSVKNRGFFLCASYTYAVKTKPVINPGNSSFQSGFLLNVNK